MFRRSRILSETDNIRREEVRLTGDSRFGAPFIDVDEWRDQPARHRYVHGGFEDTHTRFSFYFPPAEKYRGRFFQYLEGGAGGHDNLLAPPGADATYLR